MKYFIEILLMAYFLCTFAEEQHIFKNGRVYNETEINALKVKALNLTRTNRILKRKNMKQLFDNDRIRKGISLDFGIKWEELLKNARVWTGNLDALYKLVERWKKEREIIREISPQHSTDAKKQMLEDEYLIHQVIKLKEKHKKGIQTQKTYRRIKTPFSHYVTMRKPKYAYIKTTKHTTLGAFEEKLAPFRKKCTEYERLKEKEEQALDSSKGLYKAFLVTKKWVKKIWEFGKYFFRTYPDHYHNEPSFNKSDFLI